MSSVSEVKVPDIGSYRDVPVIEILVKPGERVAKEQGLITLESDKATLEVPASVAGVLKELRVKLGDKVSEGVVIAVIETAASAEQITAASAPPRAAVAALTPAATPAKPLANGAGDPEPRCQLLVLGAGPGGYTAAFRAADLGLDVVLVERYPQLGGVCLNVGCIPSKALLHAAAVIDGARHAADFGLHFGPPEIALDDLRGYKDKVVGQLTQGLASMARQRKLRVITGHGQFVSPNAVEIVGANGTSLMHFEQCIIAAGSQPVKLPGFPWDDPRVMDSTDALKLTDIPPRLLVVGGGIIGLEMATVYRALGSRVTVVELMDQLIPGADRDLVKPLADRLRKLGVELHLKVKAGAVLARPQGLEVSFEGEAAPDSALFDRVLVAVGRRPNGDRIGAERAGVRVDPRGFIPVDPQMRSNQPHIFAIGDLVGPPMLAHKASHEAKVAAEVAAGHRSSFVASVIPSVAYTDPEIAWVGLTETEARAAGTAVGVSKFPWAASGRAIGLGRSEGFTKLLFDEGSGRLLGAGIVGPHAGELIAEATLAIELGADAEDLSLSIHPHPTLSESIGLAAEIRSGTITDLYLPKKPAR